MSTSTANYNLAKQSTGENVDSWGIVENNNLDIIDAEIKAREDKITSHSADNSNPHGETLNQTSINAQYIQFDNPTENPDLRGTGASWKIPKDGKAEFKSIKVDTGTPLKVLSFTRETQLGSNGNGLGNRIFTLVNPYVIGDDSLSVYVEGMLQRKGIAEDYQETDNVIITFNKDIDQTAKVTFDIGRKTNQSFGAIDIFTAAGGESVIPTSFQYVIGQNQIDVFKNGTLLTSPLGYIESGINQITLAISSSPGDVVVIRQARDPLATAHAYRHNSGGSDTICCPGNTPASMSTPRCLSCRTMKMVNCCARGLPTHSDRRCRWAGSPSMGKESPAGQGDAP